MLVSLARLCVGRVVLAGVEESVHSLRFLRRVIVLFQLHSVILEKRWGEISVSAHNAA